MKKRLTLLLLIALVVGVGNAYRQPIEDLLRSREISFETALRETFLTMDDSLFAAGYDLTASELTETWNRITNRCGDLFHVSPRYEYTITSNGLILTITPQYTMGQAEYEAALADYHSAIADIISSVDPAWTDVQKALYLHDYIAMHYAYDESTILNNAYELLTYGTAVCQGYTQLYGELLTAYGIPNSYIISEEMRHTWNLVQLDGSWYHVDVTHDDPVSDRLGKVNHSNFLRSDMGLADHSFSADEGMGLCIDTRYDSGAPWQDVASGFIPMGDCFYFIKNGDLYKWMGNDTYYIDTIYATWYTDNTQTSYWTGHYSTLWAAGDVLLYSKPDRIMSYDPNTGVYAIVYRYEGPGDIYGMQYIDGVLKLQVGTTPNEPGTIVTVDDFTIPY